MRCPVPHCKGTLRTAAAAGFCEFCHQPASACSDCGAWNRAFAVFCRQCGRAGTVWKANQLLDAAALGAPRRRTTLPQPIQTPPAVATGLVWAMGEGGDLYRLNPCAPAGEQIAVHERFWAHAQPHAFRIGRLQPGFGPSTAGQLQTEDCALVATSDRVLVSGLFSRQRRSFTPAAGESWLQNSRDEYHFAVAHRSSAFVLSRSEGQTRFCELNLQTGEIQRFTVTANDRTLCGPALLEENGSAYPVIWSAEALWIYTRDELTRVPLPEAVTLSTAPSETGPGFPPGRGPAIGGAGRLYLAARQFGRPALLRLARGPQGWSTTLIAVKDEGTLSETASGDPLLSTTGRLLACTGANFQTLVADAQLATRLPAWAQRGLSLSFCEANYQGLKQWVKAYNEGTETALDWDLSPGEILHACDGFHNTGTALSCLCVLSDKGLRTEFFSWCL